MGGTGGLVGQGAGSVTLSGSNGFTGGTVAQAGALVLAGGSALWRRAAVDAVQRCSWPPADTGALSGAGQVVLGTHTLTTGSAASSVFNGSLGGDGGLVKQGAGSLTLAGSNHPASGTRVAAGTLVLAAAGALPDGAAVQVDTGATLQLQADKTLGAITGTGAVALGSHWLTLDSAADTAFGGGIAGSGGLVKRGSGALTLSGTNLFTGGTLVAAGQLRLAGGAALADAGWLQLLAGSGQLGASRPARCRATAGRPGPASRRHRLVSSAAPSARRHARQARGGRLVLGGVDQLGGPWWLLACCGSTTMNGAPDALLTLAACRPTSANLALAPGRLRGGRRRRAVGPAISHAGGAWRGPGAAGQPSTAVAGAACDNRGYSGQLCRHAARVGWPAPDDVRWHWRRRHRGRRREVLGASAARASRPGVGQRAAGGTAADDSFAGSFSGAGGLAKQGTGTLTLTAASSHAAGTQVLGGALQISDDASLGDGAAALRLDGGTLRMAGAGLLQLAASRPLLLGGGGGTLDVQAAAGQLDVLGALGGTGSLRKLGDGSLRLATAGGFSGGGLAAGTLRLAGGDALPMPAAGGRQRLQIVISEAHSPARHRGAAGHRLTLGAAGDASFGGSFTAPVAGPGRRCAHGASSHAGGTRVGQGRLLVSDDSQLGAVAGALVLDGGILASTGTRNVALDAGRSVVVGAQGGTLDASAAAGLDLHGPLSGGGTLAKQGAGALRLAGDNSGFSGALDLQAGSLVLQHARALAGANALNLATGTLLDVQQSVTIGSLAGAGGATLAAGATLSTGLAGSRFDGTLGGDGALLKLGPGVLALAGANAHRGGTTLLAGTLQLLGGSALPDDAALAMAGGTLQVDASERVGAFSGHGAVALAGGQVLTVGDAASTRFDGGLVGGGALAKRGAGTLTLGGSSIHSGGTLVSDGVLAVASDAALGDRATLARRRQLARH
jgi:autotransporter-associated beta strand protein